MQKNSNYRQGVFHPIKKEKYRGSTPIVYRSSLELKAFRWFDKNLNIISWGSESVVIPYISPADNKLHRYFVDANIVLKDDDSIVKYLIEIKPHTQTLPPQKRTRKKATTILYESITYSINQAKWEAAKQWCKKHNYKFLIITEKHLE